MLLRRVAEARAEAERANRAKTLLLANVSHELRTPLTAILGLGDLLTRTRLDDEQRKMVQTIRGAGGVLLRHIEGLLTVSRDEIAAEAPPVETVDLYALLVSLRDMLAVEADRKGVRLGLSMDAGAPRFIRAESALLLDTIQNLGGNAVKFTDRGAVALHVSAKHAGGGLLLRIEARDTGIGIDKAAQDRIFETFVQGGPDIAARFGGSGLGLAIARRRIEARGGRIGVQKRTWRGRLVLVRADGRARPRRGFRFRRFRGRGARCCAGAAFRRRANLGRSLGRSAGAWPGLRHCVRAFRRARARPPLRPRRGRPPRPA